MKLIVMLAILGCSSVLDTQTAKPAQTPTPAQTTPAQTPTPAKPKPRAAPAAAATATLALTITDGKGAPLSGVAVKGSGPLDREATTDGTGSVRLEGLRSGIYRFRFTREGFITLERDISLPAGQRSLDQHVMLSASEKPAPAPPPPPAPEPPKPTNTLPPPGKAVTVSVPAFIEQNFIGGSQPQKASAIACSGLSQTVLWQIREPWQNREHEGADAMLYVVGGEGTLRIDTRDVPLQAGTFLSVPRGTTYALTRRGRNPLIVLANLAGEPCAP